MLSSAQIDTVSGIVSNYKHYVVYYYADYHNYQPGETRDSRIEIYVGSDISADGSNFTFGDDVECYYLTDSKYLSRQDCSSQFTVNNSEIVYTDCISCYPDLCYFESKINNLNFENLFIMLVLLPLTISIFVRIFLGGSK